MLIPPRAYRPPAVGCAGLSGRSCTAPVSQERSEKVTLPCSTQRNVLCGSIRIWSAGAGAGAMLVLARDAPRVEPRTITPRGSLPAAEQALVEMFQNAAPSVAYITTEVLQPTGFFTATVAKGAGSGFVWDGDGHVVTN